MENQIYWLEIIEKLIFGTVGSVFILGGFWLLKNGEKVRKYLIGHMDETEEKYPLLGTSSYEKNQMVFMPYIVGIFLIAVGIATIIKYIF